MNVLGIETSCDETSASVVCDGKKVLSNIVSSSLNLHRKYGGIVPEIASRMQLETITCVAQEALRKARISLTDIGLVSVTSNPGLSGSLLVGLSFAEAVSFGLSLPLLGLDHVHSHIYANFLEAKTIKFPFVALVVSGGHTSLFYVKGFKQIKILGQTLDDACGEAFDKVAKLLGLGYPGGPLIEKLAQRGNSKKIKFRCCGTKGELDFSFSGIKTAVLYLIKARRLSVAEKSDIAASFQETIIDSLLEKSFLACKMKKANRLLLGGGVIANNRLREKFLAAAEKEGLRCYFPQKKFCMDNAAMVAGFGYQLFNPRFCL